MPEFKQLPATLGCYQTVKDTMWLYPTADIEVALSNTSYKYTFDGTHIICPDMSNLNGLYSDIYQQTTLKQPYGNAGYSLGVGTYLQNFGKTLYWQAPNGNTIIKWQLVKQLTEQSSLPVPGQSPQGTVGYVTTYNTEGSTAILDGPYVALGGGIVDVTPLGKPLPTVITDYQPQSGPVGTQVTITGSNLTGHVSFNNITASIVSNDGSTMVVTVPSTTTGSLVVNGILAGTFTVGGGPPNTFIAVAWGENDRTIYRSIDGTNFVNSGRTVSFPSQGGVNIVKFNNKLYMLENSGLYVSTDKGLNWSSVTLPFYFAFAFQVKTSLFVLNNTLFLVSMDDRPDEYGNVNYPHYLYKSSDGSSFTLSYTVQTQFAGFANMIYFNSQYYIFKVDTILKSSDALNWTSSQILNNTGFERSIITDGSIILAVVRDASFNWKVYRSTDGVNFSQVYQNNLYNIPISVHKIGSLYTLITSNGDLTVIYAYTSSDGITWTLASQISGNWYFADFQNTNDNTYVYVGNYNEIPSISNTILRFDGTSWLNYSSQLSGLPVPSWGAEVDWFNTFSL